MRVADRVQAIVDANPPDASVTLSMSSLREWLSDRGSDLDHDLTVEDVGEFFDRSPTTIRTWIRTGQLVAYHFRGREYRITRAALEEFGDRERNGS